MSCLKGDLELGPPGVEIFWSCYDLLLQAFKDSSYHQSVLIIKQVIVSMEWADGVRGKVIGNVQVSSLSGYSQTQSCPLGVHGPHLHQWKHVWMMACSLSPYFSPGMVFALRMILVSGSQTSLWYRPLFLSFLFSCSLVHFEVWLLNLIVKHFSICTGFPKSDLYSHSGKDPWRFCGSNFVGRVKLCYDLPNVVIRFGDLEFINDFWHWRWRKPCLRTKVQKAFQKDFLLVGWLVG